MANHIELCNHIKADGNVCESPALNDEDYCFFHRESRERIKRQRRAARRKQPFQLPVLEDAAAIQLAIGDTINALLAGQIDHKTAGLVLYGLQTAAGNARHVTFEIDECSRRFDSYETGEQDSLEEEIQEEIQAEQRAAQNANPIETAPRITAGTAASEPEFPPKKSSESVPSATAAEPVQPPSAAKPQKKKA